MKVAKVIKLVSEFFPDYCLCYQGANQTFEHWIYEYPTFNLWCTKLFKNFKTICEKIAVIIIIMKIYSN